MSRGLVLTPHRVGLYLKHWKISMTVPGCAVMCNLIHTTTPLPMLHSMTGPGYVQFSIHTHGNVCLAQNINFPSNPLKTSIFGTIISFRKRNNAFFGGRCERPSRMVAAAKTANFLAAEKSIPRRPVTPKARLQQKMAKREASIAAQTMVQPSTSRPPTLVAEKEHGHISESSVEERTGKTPECCPCVVTPIGCM